jgi:hypothetical protein
VSKVSEIIDKPNKAKQINKKSPNVIPTIIDKLWRKLDKKEQVTTDNTVDLGTITTKNMAPSKLIDVQWQW